MYTYYFIPGLIADSRSFQPLCEIMELAHYKFIRWDRPNAKESIQDYARRLSQQIDVRDRPVFVGVSMGGIMATELSKLHNDAPVILIASAKCKAEVPPYYRLMKGFRPQKWLPITPIKKTLLKLKPAHTHPSPWHFELFRDMLLDTDPVFMKWALGQIASWDRTSPPKHYIHLHGTDDKLFPIQYIQDHTPVEGGKHFMIVEKAPEIATKILEWQSNFKNFRSKSTA